jgi:hypothetical protein
MARKTKTVVIEKEGRDLGKTYLLTEMDTFKAEKWAARLILALIKSGIELPEGSADQGMAGLMSVVPSILKGVGGISWEVLEPLLDEMMNCVEVIPDSNKPAIKRKINEAYGDIEEVLTLMTLRAELIELHTGFSFAAAN